MNPQVTSIKRIIGLPGDRIKTKPPFPSPEMVVQPGHVWVEGDGETTLDSNTYGPISIRLITGKITHAIWPLSKMGKIDWRDAPPRREPAGQAGRDTGR